MDQFRTEQGRVERQRTRTYLYRSTKRMQRAGRQGRSSDAAARDEARFERQHHAEAVRRLAVAAGLDAALRTTPAGGFWKLGPRKLHTPGCELLAGKNLTVRQLARINPTKMHAGCGCTIAQARADAPWATRADITRAQAAEARG